MVARVSVQWLFKNEGSGSTEPPSEADEHFCRTIESVTPPLPFATGQLARHLDAFSASPWYDAIHSWKDYKRETERLVLLMEQHAQRPLATLLDVACGTGQHLSYLKVRYTAEGLDIDVKMLDLARRVTRT